MAGIPITASMAMMLKQNPNKNQPKPDRPFDFAIAAVKMATMSQVRTINSMTTYHTPLSLRPKWRRSLQPKLTGFSAC